MTSSFLDMQAYVGISKHIGGLPATRTLLSLCHAEDADEILEVGSGIGVGPVHAATSYGCRVVGIDLSDRVFAAVAPAAGDQALTMGSRVAVSAFLGLLRWWLETDQPLSPDEVNDAFAALILPGVAGVLGVAPELLAEPAAGAPERPAAR